MMRQPALSLLLALSFANAHAQSFKLDERLPDYVRATLAAEPQKIRSAGSTTLAPLLNRWSEDFRRIHATVQIDISGGGSGAGFAALLEGSADLAAMSRPANAKEIDAFTKKFGSAPTQIVVGVDAISVYVNKNNPLRRISLSQLDALYGAQPKRGGKPVRTWGDLGIGGPLAEKNVVLRGPATTHGMYALFRDEVLQGGEYRFEMISEIVPSIIVQNIGADETSIGFASHFYASQRTRMLPVSQTDDSPAIAPSQQTAVDGSYPLARQLFVYLDRNAKAPAQAAAIAFLRFACSRQGQAGSLSEGSFPLDAASAQKDCIERLQ